MNTVGETQKGFSLLELMVVMVMIAVLASMATQSYTIYKQKAQHSSAIVLFNQARSSLEGGKINSESDSFSDPVMEFDQLGPGIPGGEYGQILLAGLVLPENHKVFVRHVTDCNDSICVEDVISVRHCQTGKMATLTMFHSGSSVINLQAEASLPCS